MSGAGRQIDEEVLASGLTSSRTTEVVIAAAAIGGLSVTATGPTQYRLSRMYRPGWVVPTAMVGALFFGLGLLLLLIVPKRIESCTVTMSESRRGVIVKLSGVLPEYVTDQIRVGLVGQATSTPASPATIAAAPPASASPVDPQSPAVSRVPPSVSIPPMPSSWAPTSFPDGPISEREVEATVARGSLPPAWVGVGALALAAPSIRLGDRAWSLSSGIVVGRNPSPIDQLLGAQLVSVGDAGLSKTHLAIRLSGSTIEVCDLSSTNGTAIEVNQQRHACSPETWIAIGHGAAIVAGDQRLEVIE